MTRLLRTGRVPGRPRQTGQVLALGASPKRVEQAQKILVLVSSWTWTSRPMTGSYLASTSGLREAASADLVILKRQKYSIGGNESRAPPPWFSRVSNETTCLAKCRKSIKPKELVDPMDKD